MRVRTRRKTKKGEPAVTRSLWQRDWPWSLFLVAAIVVVYYRLWPAGFIWDDAEHLTQNPCIIGPLGFKDIWTSSRAVYYPLVLTTFWILHKFVQLNPLPYHLLNVSMHAASAVLLWQVLRQLRVRAAWLGAALWALHPVMVQSVAWITELKNTQSCFFYLLSILFFLKADDSAAETQRRWRFGLSLAFFVMAITSKPATVMLPVVLILCLWWRRGGLRSRDVAPIVPFVLISAAASGWTIWEQKFHSGALGAEWSQTWPERLVIAGRDVWFYAGKLFWPNPLIFIYPRWHVDATQPVNFLPLIAAVGGGLLLWLKRNGPLRPVFFAVAYFILSLFPVLSFFNVYFFRYSFVSDHFQYLAAMGPLALIGSGVAVAAASLEKRSSWIQAGAGAVLLLILATLTWAQTKNYADAEALYRATIEKNPSCSLAYNNLGAIAFQEHRLDEAQGYYEKALAVEPGIPESQYNIGNVLFAKNDFAQAIGAYEGALRGQPDNITARNNLAVSLIATGHIDQAIEQLNEALRLRPNDADTHYNLGHLFVQLGRPEEALPHLRAAIRLKPDYEKAKQDLRVLGMSVPPL